MQETTIPKIFRVSAVLPVALRKPRTSNDNFSNAAAIALNVVHLLINHPKLNQGQGPPGLAANINFIFGADISAIYLSEGQDGTGL